MWAGDALLFRVGQGIVEIQGVSGNFLFKYGFCKFFEVGVFRKYVAGKPGEGEELEQKNCRKHYIFMKWK